MSLNKIENNPYITSTLDQQDHAETQGATEDEILFQALFENDGYRSVLIAMVENVTNTQLPCPRAVGELRDTNPEIYKSIRSEFSTLLHEARKTNGYFDQYYTTLTTILGDPAAIQTGIDSPYATFAGKDSIAKREDPFETFYGNGTNNGETILFSNSDE